MSAEMEAHSLASRGTMNRASRLFLGNEIPVAPFPLLVFALHTQRITSDPGRVSRRIHLMTARDFFLILCTENIGFPGKFFKHSLCYSSVSAVLASTERGLRWRNSEYRTWSVMLFS